MNNQKYLCVVLYLKRGNCNRRCCRWRAGDLLVPYSVPHKHASPLPCPTSEAGVLQVGSDPVPIQSAEIKT